MSGNLLIGIGESNIGGGGENVLALASELDENNNIRIYNNQLGIIQNLKISNPGSNNILDHLGLEASPGVGHGFCLRLASLADLGLLTVPLPFHILKAGQGGSLISQWQLGGTYWNIMKTRIECMLGKMEEAGYDRRLINIYFFISIGINDANAHTTKAGFKSLFTTIINDLIYRFPITNIVCTEIPLNDAYHITINDGLNELASEISILEIAQAIDLPTRVESPSHWGYNSWKILSERMLDKAGLI